MPYKNILVAYDGSEQSKRALSAALEFVDAGLGEHVVMLSAYDPDSLQEIDFEIAARLAGGIMHEGPAPQELVSEIQSTLESEFADHLGCIELVTVYGKPAEAIVNTAKTKDCGLIVMGSRGLGAVKAALGSVSSAVLRSPNIPPVMITR